MQNCITLKAFETKKEAEEFRKIFPKELALRVQRFGSIKSGLYELALYYDISFTVNKSILRGIPPIED